MTAAELQRQVAALAERVAALEAIVQRDVKPAKVVVGWRVKQRCIGGPWLYVAADDHDDSTREPSCAALFVEEHLARQQADEWNEYDRETRLVRVTRRVRP